jgi:nicotinate-nucleotide adenylyltransferase
LRLGILGGVFNPPHIGHLVCAQEALLALELEHVLLVPVGDPPHRRVERDPGPEVRLELCRAAVAGDERLGASSIEVDRPGPSYTVDTLRAFRDEHATGSELVLILGSDQAADLSAWREPEAVLELAEVGVVTRGGVTPDEVRRRIAALTGAERVRFFEMPRVDVSSSLVRRRAAEHLPIRYLVPEAVERLVTVRGLYRTSAVPA